MKNVGYSALAIIALFSILTAGAHAQPHPDLSFGNNGKKVIWGFVNNFPGHPYGIEAATARGGGITVVDSSGGVAKLEDDGKRVAKFGYKQESKQSSVSFGTIDLRRRNDGRLVGLSSWGSQTKSSSYLYLLTADGKIDRTFGRRGKKVLAFERGNGVGSSEFLAMDVDSKGRIVVAGRGPFGRYLIVRRFLANGSTDRSFAKGGTWRGRFGRTRSGESVSDLKSVGNAVVVAGTTDSRGLVFKLNNLGSLDKSFGNNGKTYGRCGPGGCRPNFVCYRHCLNAKLVALADGTLLLLRYQASKNPNWENVLYRFRVDGSSVRSFGRDGVLPLTSRVVSQANPATSDPGKLLGELSSAVPSGRHGFVLGTYANVKSQGMRSIGIRFSGSGEAIKGLAFSLPVPEGSWGMYRNGNSSFFVTGRSGSKPIQKDEVAVYKYLTR